mmetsp:Transcript_27960/g.65217  ORF Transcript_27960/g.65217 Transcript_27960/m.65217 type:complete len:722 (-) Transcript_27960:571-2736(-)
MLLARLTSPEGARLGVRRPQHSLEGREDHIQKPEPYQTGTCQQLGSARSSKFAFAEAPPQLQGQDAGYCTTTKDGHAEGQAASLHHKDAVLPVSELEWHVHIFQVPILPLLTGIPAPPDEGGKHPRQAQTEEDVHRVAPRDVADGRVCVCHHDGRRLGGKGVRQGGSQRHDSDGSDLVWKRAHATKERGQITDHHRDEADHEEGTHKAHPATAVVRGRHESEEQLPRHRYDVQDPILLRGWLTIIATIHEDGVDELLFPVGVPNLGFVPIDSQRAYEAIYSVFAPLVRLNEDSEDGALLSAILLLVETRTTCCLREDDAEILGALVTALAPDHHLDRGRSHPFLEDQLPIQRNEVPICHGARALGFIMACDPATTTVGALDIDLHFVVPYGLRHVQGLLWEAYDTRQVIINNDNSRTLVLAKLNNILTGRRGFTEVDEEVFVILVGDIINNFHFNLFFGLSGTKGQRTLDMDVVLRSLSHPVPRGVPHRVGVCKITSALDGGLHGACVLEHRVARCSKLDDCAHLPSLLLVGHALLGRHFVQCQAAKTPRELERLTYGSRDAPGRVGNGLAEVDPSATRESSRRGHAVLGPRHVLVALHERYLRHLFRRKVLSVLLADPHVQQGELLLGHVCGEDELLFRRGLGKVAPVCEEGNDHEHREEEESHDALPRLHYVLRVPLNDDKHPQVRKDGEGGGHHINRHLLDPPDLTVGDREDADRDDA